MFIGFNNANYALATFNSSPTHKLLSMYNVDVIHVYVHVHAGNSVTKQLSTFIDLSGV